jgi:hypothetical protein
MVGGLEKNEARMREDEEAPAVDGVASSVAPVSKPAFTLCDFGRHRF